MGNYLDLEDIEEYTRTTYTELTTPKASTINSFIDEAEQEIDEITGRSWGSSTVTEIYDFKRNPNGKTEIKLKNYPILTISSIKDADDNELTEGVDDDYTVEDGFIILNDNLLINRIKITYTYGYSPVRADAKILTRLLVLDKMKQSESTENTNTESISVGPITLTERIGTQTVLNLSSDIEKKFQNLRRLLR